MSPTIPTSTRAVLFDIYGTLLDGPRHPDRAVRMAEVARRFGLHHPSPLDEAWDRAVAAAHRISPEPWPEIDARELWRTLFPGLREAASLALEMEHAIHPVAPTPWAHDLLDQALDLGIPLGIVSNAQAYTRSLMRRHFPGHWPRFDPRLLAFSYEHGIAKPDPRLFQVALRPLLAAGIDRGDILLIGDSEPHDAVPARQLGLGFRRVSG